MSRCAKVKSAALRATNRCLHVKATAARARACRRSDALVSAYLRACGKR